MNKQEFIDAIKPQLKEIGYRKNGNYWYKEGADLICCINVQGSQWSADDYYVNIGFSLPSKTKNNPTLLHWYCRRRCIGEHGDVNISLTDFFSEYCNLFNAIQSFEQLSAFLTKNAQKVCSQYWF